MHAREFRVRPAVMWKLLRLSFGGMLQYFVGTSSWILLVRMTAPFGSVVIAGYTVMLRIIMFALLPSWGMANAAATLVGQNLGAKKPDRAERAVWLAGFYNMIVLGIVAILFVTFARQLVGVFTDDEAVKHVAASALRIISCGYMFYAWGMVAIQAFNGAGDTRDADAHQPVLLLGLPDADRLVAGVSHADACERDLRGDRHLAIDDCGDWHARVSKREVEAAKSVERIWANWEMLGVK